MKKRLLSAVLALAIVLTTLPMAAFADAVDVPAVATESADLGLSGKALEIKTTGDIRVKLTGLGFTDMADGTYEVTFMVPTNENNKVPGSVGFLARYRDESAYAGLSVDLQNNGSTLWTSHYSRGLSARENIGLSTEVKLEPGVPYRAKIEYVGDKVTVYCMKKGDADYIPIGTDTLTDNYATEAGGFAVRVNAGNSGVNTVWVDSIVQAGKDGVVVKTVNFDDMNSVDNIYEARKNKTEVVDNSQATLSLVDVSTQPEPEPEPTPETTPEPIPETTPEPTPVGPVDPGLPPVEQGNRQDDYVQDLSQSTSIGGATAVNVNQDTWGMDGKALVLKTSGDTRVKFTDFGELANGAYEIAFRTGDTLNTSLGFLGRYKDESNYAGFSIDGGGGTWVIHYSEGTSRHNQTVSNGPDPLQTNTTYKMKLTFRDKNVKVEYMKEGDVNYSEVTTYTLNDSGYTGEGSFAVRVYGGADVTLDNITQYNEAGTLVKKLDFNGATPPTTSAQSNKGALGSANGTTRISFTDIPVSQRVDGFTPGRATMLGTAQGGVYVYNSSPSTVNPTYTVQLNGSSNQIGLVFNHQDENNYAAIWYNGRNWVAGGKSGGQDVAAINLFEKNIPAPVADGTRTYRIAYDTASGYILSVSSGPVEERAANGTDYVLGHLAIFQGRGKVGLYAGEAMTLYAGPIHMLYELLPTGLPLPDEGNVITLTSETMKAVVGKEFPHVYAYQDPSGKTLAYGTQAGSENTKIWVDTKANIHDAGESEDAFVECTTTSTLTGSTGSTATYEITAVNVESKINAVFTVVLTIEGNTLKMEVTNVAEEAGSATVRSFRFVDNPVLTLAGLGAGAALGMHSGWGPMEDKFISLKAASENTEYKGFTYGLFYDTAGKVSAAVENNAENANSKYILKQTVTGAAPTLSLNSNNWAWQYYDEINPEEEEKPYITVVIGGDANNDDAITWQDAGIVYRDIMKRPYGAENTKNEWMFIALNISSQTSQPFARVLDLGKAMSYLTDGFGMKIMNKGYQGAGHDDSHGDYDFVGLQQGGAEGFNTLIDVGLEYGIKNGVHANDTEFALDGFDTVLENMRGVVTGGALQRNWNWFDQAYLVDKNTDVRTGELKRRIQEFEKALPNLDFVYLDVYQAGARYKASQLVKYFNDIGITMGTEALQDLSQNITFVHWNTDLYYAVGGAQSEVMKFVTHGIGDLTAPDKALLGALMPGIADWRNTNRFSDGVDVFYRNNLPTKYLQHFELMSWEPNTSATFSNGVRTEVKGNYTNIYKNDKLIATINTSAVKNYEDYGGKPNPQAPASAEIFIPWSPEVEDKIYCYSDTGAVKEWFVPDSWSGVGTAYLYRLTTTGRVEKQSVPVTGEKVRLDLEPGVPYVLTKAEEPVAHRYDVDGSVLKEGGNTVYLPTLEEHPYGEGSIFADPGFTSMSLDSWTVTGEGTDAATVVAWTNEEPVLKLGPTFAGSVGQTVKVEPGKTYTISVWVNSAGDRPVTLTVKAGDVTESTTIKTTANHTVSMKPSKFTGKNFQRLNVDVTIPEGVQEATVALSTVSGTNEIIVDDFRSWAWSDLTGAENPGPSAKAGEYYYYEDFEHTDESWGPFVSNVNNQPFVNLAYYDNGGKQIKDYVVDASDENRTSLKGQQRDNFGTTGGDGGIIMRTEPASLSFETGYSYVVEFDYQVYLEYQKIDHGAPGKNGPLDDGTRFYVDVRKSDGTKINSYVLEPNEFDQEYLNKYINNSSMWTNSDLGSYNVHPETKTLTFTVDASTEEDIFLTFRLASSTVVGNSPHPVFAIDNFRVTQVGTEFKENDVSAVMSADYDTTQANVDTAQAAYAHAQAVVDALQLSEDVTAVVNAGRFTAPVSGTAANPEGVDGFYTFTVTLKKGESKFTIPNLTMVIAAKAYTYVPSGPTTPSTPSGPTTPSTPSRPTAPTTPSKPAGPTNSGAITETVENKDGSTTTTVTDAGTGKVTKTTVQTDGSKVEKVTTSGVGTTVKATNASGRIVAEVVIPEVISEPEAKFGDVTEGHWAEQSINNMVALGLVNGVGDGKYAPNAPMTRGALATILHRLSSTPEGAKADFGDVEAGKYYSNAVAWAAEVGVVNGVGNNGFAPNDDITREQLAVMLVRYATLLGLDTTSDGAGIGKFADAGSAHDWAVDGLAWCVKSGIMQGMSNGKLSPTTTVTRAQVATMLDRLIGLIK